MNNNDILSRVRATLGLNAEKMAHLLSTSECPVTSEDAEAYCRTQEKGAECPDTLLELFLNNLILDRRGPPASGSPPPADHPLTNNLIFKKIRIAMDMREPEVLDALEAGGSPLLKHELAALFRKPSNKHFRRCHDEVLEAFLDGLKSG